MSVASFYSLQFDDASASIRVSKHRMIQAGNDMRETALMTRQVILRSRAAMAEADRLLTRPWEKENVGGRAQLPSVGRETGSPPTERHPCDPGWGVDT